MTVNKNKFQEQFEYLNSISQYTIICINSQTDIFNQGNDHIPYNKNQKYVYIFLYLKTFKYILFKNSVKWPMIFFSLREKKKNSERRYFLNFGVKAMVKIVSVWYLFFCNNLPQQNSRLETFCWFSNYSFEVLWIHETPNSEITVTVQPITKNSQPNRLFA